MRLLSLFALFLPALALAQEPPAKDYPGRQALNAYFKLHVKQIEDNCLTNLTTQAAWEKQRPQLRQQFMEMMGLWPLPEKTNLNVKITGTHDAGDYVVEKLHFQSRPGVYVTANLYRPKDTTKKYPGILYVCGHGNVVEKGISYGSKVSYQYHPAWFATHGYVCLILDTLQLGEIPGEHHGTYRLGQWWWQARGYTPGGVELWNAIRALDYLETRTEVNANKLGVTGRSGGGATSWWVAAADDRVKCIAPVAGITSLYSHLCEAPAERLKAGVIAGHCDCMFMVNTHRWDFPLVAALAAPRPLLLGNSDVDEIFPVNGYRAVADKVRKVYDLYGAGDRFQLLETQGPHKDTPELRLGINAWMQKWLKEDTTPIPTEVLPEKLPPATLKVLARNPEDNRNNSVADFWVSNAVNDIPINKATVPQWWETKEREWRTFLTNQVFAGWNKTPGNLQVKVKDSVVSDGIELFSWDFVSEQNVILTVWAAKSQKHAWPQRVNAIVMDNSAWTQWITDFGPAFAKTLKMNHAFKRNDDRFAQMKANMAGGNMAYVAIVPRGVGPTAWAAPDSVDDRHIRRRFALIGQTVDGQRVFDIGRALQALKELQEFKNAKFTLQGSGDAGVWALYAGIFTSDITEMVLKHVPSTHKTGPVFLNVLKTLDTPQALALLHAKTITLHVKNLNEKSEWQWVETLNESLNRKNITWKVSPQE